MRALLKLTVTGVVPGGSDGDRIGRVILAIPELRFVAKSLVQLYTLDVVDGAQSNGDPPEVWAPTGTSQTNRIGVLGEERPAVRQQ